ERFGEVTPQKSIAAHPQYADLLFHPAPARRPGPPPLLRLIARMTEGPALFEPFSDNPSDNDLRDVLGKALTLHRQERTPAQQRRIGRPYAMPHTWILSPGEPRSTLARLCATHDTKLWMRGFFRLPPLFNAHLVVLRLLPVRPETLLLRLFGRGKVLREALRDLEGWFPDPVALSIAELAERWLQIANSRNLEELDMVTRELMDYAKQTITLNHEMIRQQSKLEGKLEGQREGKLEGQREGKLEGQRETLLVLLEERFEVNTAHWRTRLETVVQPEQLKALFRTALRAETLEQVDQEFNALVAKR
ncbi:MAG: hypothetical protein AAFX99_35010, partial [Myxococcota bacterium]